MRFRKLIAAEFSTAILAIGVGEAPLDESLRGQLLARSWTGLLEVST